MTGLFDFIRARYNPSPFTAGLTGAGATILANSGPSLQPKNTASILGQGLLGFIQSANQRQEFDADQQSMLLRRQLLEQQLADSGLDREFKQAQLDKIRNPQNFVDPIGDFIPTDGGQLVYGDRRTGQVKRVMLDDKWLKKADADPVTQAMITAGREGQKGRVVEGPMGEKSVMPQHQANPDFLNLFPSLIQTESSGNPAAVSPKGAQGLGQIMPETAKNPGFNVQPMRDNSVKEQLRFSHDYLSALVDYYGGDVKKALSAYNAGLGTVAKNGITNPGYVDKVLSGTGRVTSPTIVQRESMEEQGKAIGKDKGAAITQAPGDLRAGEYTLQILNKLKTHKGMPGSVGLPNIFGLTNMRGTKERDFEVLRKQVADRVFLEGFKSLKGGGQITEIEGQKATSALARLDSAQTEEEFLQAINELEQMVHDSMAAQSQKAGVPMPKSPAAGPGEDFDSILKFYSSPK